MNITALRKQLERDNCPAAVSEHHDPPTRLRRFENYSAQNLASSIDDWDSLLHIDSYLSVHYVIHDSAGSGSRANDSGSHGKF